MASPMLTTTANYSDSSGLRVFFVSPGVPARVWRVDRPDGLNAAIPKGRLEPRCVPRAKINI